MKFSNMETERKEIHSENIAGLYSPKDVKFLQKPPVVFYPDKLKGGGRPAKIQIPKLRIVRYEENQHLELLANINRPLFPYWHMFDSHDVCKYNQENNCAFCAVRNLSVRMNDAKREPYITPHELITKSIDTHCDSFALFLENVLLEMAGSCCEFKNNMGLSIKCLPCNTVLKIDEHPIINCQITQERESIHSIFKGAVEERLSSTNICCQE